MRALDYCSGNSIDVLCVNEHFLRDGLALQQIRSKLPNEYPNFRWVGCHRPMAGNGARGGVGFMVLSADVRIKALAIDPVGVVAIQIWKDGMQPVGLVGAYNPPCRSTLNVMSADGEGTSALVFQRLMTVIPQARKRCETVLVLGDFNERLGGYRGRDTVDPRRTVKGRLENLCNTLHLEPAHGKSGRLRAEATSRKIDGRPGSAEVDYILEHWETSTDRVTPLDPTPWREGGTHRPIAISIILKSSVSSTRSSKRDAPQRKRFYTPAYDNVSWYKAADEILKVLNTVGASGRRPDDVDGLYADVLKVLHAGLQTVEAAGRNRWSNYVLHGQNPPPTREMREMYEQLDTVNRKLRKRPNKQPLPTVQREELERERCNIKKAIKKAKARQRDAAIAQIAAFIHSLRAGDSHRMHMVMEAMLGKGSAPRTPEIERPEEFLEFFRNLFKETRPLPPALTKPERIAEIPVATGPTTKLVERVSSHEVYLSSQPMHAKRIAPLVNCDAECIHCMCVRGQAALHAEEPRGVPIPSAKPTLNTARSCGPDGIPADGIRFPRPFHKGHRIDYRIELSSVMADWLTACLQTGRVPGGDFSKHVTSLLFKPGTPDFPSDPQNPSDYRAITVGNTCEKLLETIIYRRLLHWAVLNDLIPATQAGFMEHMGAELHVFSLLEAIKHEWRKGRTCYALFIDFKKAYDNIHLEALWRVLATMGVPEQLLTLLKSWAANRTTSIRVGDVMSDDIQTDKGTPQGSVLSPLLFNLFIASLHKCLRSIPGWEGITVGSGHRAVTLKDLFYADDLAALCSSAAQAQLVLTAVHSWASDWGLELGIGKDKTAAMVFDPKAKAARTDLTPLRAGDTTIPWVARYKYLGYILRFDLSNSSIKDPEDEKKVLLEGMADRLRGKLDSLSKRYFARNKIMWQLPLATQFQFLGSVVQAALSYLFSVVPLSEAELDKLDVGMNECIRNILGLPDKTPLTIVQAESRIGSFKQVQLMHRFRLLQYLRHNPIPNNIASLVLRATSSEILPARCKQRFVPWITITNRMLQECSNEAAAFGHALNLDARSYFYIHKTCVIFSRDVAYIRWAADATRRAGQKLAGEGPNNFATYSPPPNGRVRSRYGIVAAADTYRISATTLPPLGSLADSTPLSIVGPGCSGSIISISTVRPKYASPALRARMGTVAVTIWPFGIPNQRPPTAARRVAAERRRQAFATLEEANRRAVSGCEYCDSIDPEDVWHVLLECPSRRYTDFRRDLIRDAPLFVSFLLDDIKSALMRYDNSYGADPEETNPAWAAWKAVSTRHVEECDWSSSTGTFLLFRLLTVLPFPPSVLPSPRSTHSDPSLTLISLLGQLFAAISLPRRFLRQFSNTWVMWSYKWLIRFGEARCNRRR